MGAWDIYLLKEECIMVLNHVKREAISEGTKQLKASTSAHLNKINMWKDISSKITPTTYNRSIQ